ncbi:PRA1 family protein 1 [Nematocida ausubeli]|nr:PRA1 family protein 1 [Nematocida ausubeli]
MESRLYNEVGYYVREKVEKRVALKEFLNLGAAGVPANLEDGKSRIIINYSAMAGNYLLVVCLLLCFFLVFHPILIIPIGICFGLLYMTTKDSSDTMDILGNSYSKMHVYCVALGLPIIFFIFMPRSLVSLFFTIMMSIILCVGHMVGYKPVVSPNEEHV